MSAILADDAAEVVSGQSVNAAVVKEHYHLQHPNIMLIAAWSRDIDLR